VGEPARGGSVGQGLRFLVDDDLSPLIAEVLGLFDVEVQTVQPALGSQGAGDEEIIPWLGQTRTIWITHDKKARTRHGQLLKRHKVTVLWIRGKKLSNWEHVKIVFRVFEELVKKVRKAHGAMHFVAGRKGGPTPEVTWAEYSQDWPRQHRLG
jgi:predicted nuclease of predicted toxin-antitoxin system